jgi:two-component system chemotaxis response regulator CheB
VGRLRALVVEDSLTVRKRIVETLSSDPEIEVVGEASNGRDGIEQCQRLRPGVVTMDMMLPVMTGLAATEYIMAYCPTPILIVSASTNRGELFRTYEALAAGAVDVLEKPLGDQPEGEWEQRLISTVKIVSHVKVITHPRLRLGAMGQPHAKAPPQRPVPPLGAACQLVAMGASTGGPAALMQILKSLPADFPLPILLVIHLSTVFAGAFAQWLDGQSRLRVRYAQDGERLPAYGESGVLLAPPDSHLLVSGGRLVLSASAPRHSCRPSVDVLFESVERELGARAIGCLLTGMGKDGALGLLALRRAGARTLAQDEATSVVYGMPREAALLGAADQVLPLEEVAPSLIELARSPSSGGGP